MAATQNNTSCSFKLGIIILYGECYHDYMALTCILMVRLVLKYGVHVLLQKPPWCSG